MIFKSPAYKEQNITSNVVVSLKLFVPNKNRENQMESGDLTEELYESSVLKFIYTPNSSNNPDQICKYERNISFEN